MNTLNNPSPAVCIRSFNRIPQSKSMHIMPSLASFLVDIGKQNVASDHGIRVGSRISAKWVQMYKGVGFALLFLSHFS